MAVRKGTTWRLLFDEVDTRMKKTRREKRKPRIKLMRQQIPWRRSQKMAAGDLTAPSLDESNGVDPRKLLDRRFR